VECVAAQTCSATFTFQGNAGRYDLAVQYFDQNTGQSKFRVLVEDRVVDEWVANDHLPARAVGGDSSTRRRIQGLALRPGDTIRIEGTPDGAEHAAFDYVEIRSTDEP
jgi:alpha-glucuronidase